MNKIKPYIEMLIILGIIYVLGFMFRPYDPYFINFKPCPYIIIVIIGAVKYGSPVGLFLGILCGVLEFSASIASSGYSIKDAFFIDPVKLLTIAVYIALGHFVGESVHSRIKKSEFFQKLSEDNKKLAETLSCEKTDIENQYRQLEANIAAESKSSYSFIKALTKFETLEFHTIGEYAAELVCKFFLAKQVEYWIKKDNTWRRIYPESETRDNLKVPALVIKSEEINDWATCRDYPELATQDGVDLAMCYRSTRTHEHHAITCVDIPFTEWGLQLEDRLMSVLRESVAANDFWILRFALNEATPIEQKLRVESLKLFKNQVHRQLLTLKRSNSTSSLLFICVDKEIAKDIRVLGVIASCLRTMLRASDGLSFVQSGDYFVLFLPQTPLEGASVVMSKINQAIDGLGLKPKDRKIQLRPAYYELTKAEMLEESFDDFRKDLLV